MAEPELTKKEIKPIELAVNLIIQTAIDEESIMNEKDEIVIKFTDEFIKKYRKALKALA